MLDAFNSCSFLQIKMNEQKLNNKNRHVFKLFLLDYFNHKCITL